MGRTQETHNQCEEREGTHYKMMMGIYGLKHQTPNEEESRCQIGSHVWQKHWMSKGEVQLVLMMGLIVNTKVMKIRN